MEPAKPTGSASPDAPPSDGDATLPNWASPWGEAAGLHVRCPHCCNPIELLPDAHLESFLCPSCGSNFSLLDDESHATRDARGVTELAHFRLVERVGMGAFGSVWKALDTRLDRTVAVKIPRAGQLTPQQQEQFLREARTAAQLRHPRIVPVHEVGREGGTLYIVSDFIHGLTLADWLTGQQPTPREAAMLCSAIAEALEYAHERGVVHRDLKPGNVMLDEAGQPHLMDFGLAKRDAGEITVTLEGNILGTPAYMAPEQARGDSHEADRRSDVYSLGVILFQLLTGELPFRGNPRMLIHQVVHDDPPNPRKLNANIPRDLETISLKCLEKNPERRYQAASDVDEELQRWLDGQPIKARPTTRVERAWRLAKRNPQTTVLVSAILLTLTLSAVGGMALARRSQHNEAAALSALAEADKQRRYAESVNDFYVDGVMGLADPSRGHGSGITLRDALKLASENIEERFPDDDELRLVVCSQVGRLLLDMDETAEAEPRLLEAAEIADKTYGHLSREALKAWSDYAYVLVIERRYEKGEVILREVLGEQRDLLGAGATDTIQTAIWVCLVMRESSEQGDRERAAEFARETYQTAVGSLGPDHPSTLDAQSSLSWALRWLGKYDEALLHGEASSRGLRRVLGDLHRVTGYAWYNYAACLQSVGRLDEAIAEARALREVRRRNLGPAHLETLWTTVRLVWLYKRSNDLDAAAALYDELGEDCDQLCGAEGERCIGVLKLLRNEARNLQLSDRAEELDKVLASITVQSG